MFIVLELERFAQWESPMQTRHDQGIFMVKGRDSKNHLVKRGIVVIYLDCDSQHVIICDWLHVKRSHQSLLLIVCAGSHLSHNFGYVYRLFAKCNKSLIALLTEGFLGFKGGKMLVRLCCLTRNAMFYNCFKHLDKANF